MLLENDLPRREKTSKEQLKIMVSRFVANMRLVGGTFRSLWKVRNHVPASQKGVYILMVLLPIVGLVFVENQIIAFIYFTFLLFYIPLLDAYAYAIVNGG